VSTPAHDSGPALTAVILQITQHAERLAVLDQREAGRYHDISAQLADLCDRIAATSERVHTMEAATARQGAILDALDGLDQHVAALADRLTQMASAASPEDSEEYQPFPAPRWWALDGPERKDALSRLRAWVDQVYRPSYGHLATALGSCWEQHLLCLYGLDWLMELWSALYLTTKRKPGTLAGQAEWQSRLLPALAAQMHAETSRCQHAHPSDGHWATSRSSHGPHRPQRRGQDNRP
jgi:hypothetical protein